VLSVPPGVDERKVDLSIELQILAFDAERRAVVRVALGDAAPVNGSCGVTHAMATGGPDAPFSNPRPRSKLREVGGEGACDRPAREDAASRVIRRRAEST
jgi:hypothetical protein